MSDPSENFAAQSAAFQKIWLESMSKVMQTAFASAPNSAPPELLRQIRDGILQALADAWNEFLRSPQFQAGMKQWMDQAVAFRQTSGDFLAKARKEMQAPTSADLDAILLAVRHLETRLLDRIEGLSAEVQGLRAQAGPPPAGAGRPRRKPKSPPAPPAAKPKGAKP
jgi:hypothetical protein